MEIPYLLSTASVLAPPLLMLLAAAAARTRRVPPAASWRLLQFLSMVALAASAVALLAVPAQWQCTSLLRSTSLGQLMALLVQLLGTVIGAFCTRYLQGEAGQGRAIGALAAVLAAVQILLLADHWLVLIAAWALVGVALEPLLCFYPERPFAQLAALKKRIADRAADLLLIAAALLAWHDTGSASLTALWAHAAAAPLSPSLQLCAVALVLAVILRCAQLPVHGWLIQVMEAPTPVSALLHAGVVNLGGFVLIRFAPLLEQASAARTLLLVFGLGTALLAGMVMLTRISIKVRLAWSTVAQMGFMLLECALGLYTLAALHLVGHSLYKAHAFLAASTAVRQTRLAELRGASVASGLSVLLAPPLAVAAVLLTVSVTMGVTGAQAWPWWWSAILGLAWAPLLWMPAGPAFLPLRLLAGLSMVAGLTGATLAVHALPLGLTDAPHHLLGCAALGGMALLYLCLALLQLRPALLARWRRWSYAGFYVDEASTRLALCWWPARQARAASPLSVR